MNAEMLLALRDPAGVPSHPLVFLLLGVLTFALHIAAVQVMLSVIEQFPGAQAGNPHAEYLPPVGVEQRRKLMSEAAAFLCPTQYIEPFGNVALEAQISGTPVICTDWGGFSENVQHGFTGYRCRTMEQFVWAANNIDHIRPEVCREWVLNNYSMNRIRLMFEEYFQSVLDLGRGGWYEERPERNNLDWLQRSYPV